MKQSSSQTRTEKNLLEAARLFNSTLEYEELIQLVLRLVIKALNAEAALVFRIDHNRTDMKIRMMKAVDEKMTIFHRELGQGVVGWVAQYREEIIINDPANDPRVDSEFAKAGEIEFRSLISVPLIGRGQMIGVVEAINKDDSDFTQEDLDILIGINNQIAVAIDNAHLYREVRRESAERKALYEVGNKLSSSLKVENLLNDLLDLLHEVLDFDAAGIFLIDPESGELKAKNTVGYDRAISETLHVKIGQGLIGRVANDGEAIIVADVSKDDRYILAHQSTLSEIVVPIKLDDKIIGVLNLESNQSNAYDHRSITLLDAFASQAAVSLERARLHESLLDSRKLEEQLNIAREIQRSFLPDSDPIIVGYEITGTNISSGQVGGDYYDFIKIVDGHLGVAIGDVSGKGMPAALIMASFRASLIAEIRNNYSIRTICTKVNSLLCESMEPGNFVTAVYGVLDFKNHIFTFANCGHNLPVILRADNSVEYLAEGGPVLGVTNAGIYEERAVVLNKGDICMLYTDGVTEVFDSNGEEFGLDRIIDLLIANRDKSVVEIKEKIFQEINPFASAEHLFDDLTMIIFKRQ